MNRLIKIFILLLFSIFSIQVAAYGESKYRNVQKKFKVKENIPKTYVSQEQIGQQEESDLVIREQSKTYWMGIILNPKKGQDKLKYLEDKLFKIFSDAFFKTENIKLYGEKVFKDKLNKLGVSEKAVILAPDRIMGTSSEINGIIIIVYFQNPEDKHYSIEIKLSDIVGGKFYKLSINELSDIDIDAKIKAMAESLVTKLQMIINENYKSMQVSYDNTAEEYYENGKSYNIQKLYAQAVRELEKAIKIEPKMTKAYSELSLAVFMSTKDRQKQVKVLELGVKNNPNDFDLRLELGKLYATIGEKKKSREQYNYIIIMDKESKTEAGKLADQLIKLLYVE
ncbi:MAG: hypothetical protein HY934_07095 [Candidatus Firestonebacteria bacterium]|nr:hypothetical protein [Candidatus Firestonebacteria bacterium]